MQSQYKSLLISERTTIDDLIELLLRCHSNNERIERFSIYEVNIHFRYRFDLFFSVEIDLFDFGLFWKNSFLTFFCCCCRFVISLATSTNGNYIPTIWRWMFKPHGRRDLIAGTLPTTAQAWRQHPTPTWPLAPNPIFLSYWSAIPTTAPKWPDEG